MKNACGYACTDVCMPQWDRAPTLSRDRRVYRHPRFEDERKLDLSANADHGSPEDQAKVLAATDSHSASPICRVNVCPSSDGSMVWLEKHGHAFFDAKGKMQRMIGMIADITEQDRRRSPL